MLEYAKDRVIRVDTLGQHVSPRVRYGMAYLLIRDAVGSVPCSDEWEIGTMYYLSNAMVLHTTLAKLDIRPIVNLCNGM
jgi:hypothetical protein